MSYYVTGTGEHVENSDEWLKKEEAHCRDNPSFLEEWWRNDKTLSGDFAFDDALKIYLDGLREDVKNNPTYRTQ